MTPTAAPLSFKDRVSGINRRLIRNLALLILALVATLLIAVIWFDAKLLDKLSRDLVRNNSAAIADELYDFFNPSERILRVALRQLEDVDLKHPGVPDRLRHLLTPLVSEFRRISGAIVADLHGNSYFLTKRDGELLERYIYSPTDEPDKAHWRRFKDGEEIEAWTRAATFRSMERPWFKAVENAPLNEIHWTEPYIFFSSKDPGITVSARWEGIQAGGPYIAALDLTLAKLSEFTRGLHPTPNAKVFVIDNEERVLGLPDDPRFDDPQTLQASILTKLGDLNIAAISDALAAWRAAGSGDGLFSFDSGGETWWAGFSDHEEANSKLRIGVLLPERDLLADIVNQRNLAVGSIIGFGLLVAGIIVLRSIRRMRTQMNQEMDRIEQTLGQYHLQYRIGDGGNGTVYRARHALLRRPTAIKVMRAEFAHSTAAMARFEQEAQITSSLTHPSTVAIYDFGTTPEGAPYYAMELLTGFTLDELVRNNGPAEPARVLHILEQVCGSLAEAHGRGLIHRDVKPSNIMLCERGGLYDVVKVLDFGLVKALAADDPDVTQANVLVGTPHYLAPELIKAAGQASVRSDIYALGATAYFLLCGTHVFEGSSNVEVCAHHLHDEPIPPSQRVMTQIPQQLEAIILACLAKDPDDRPQSAAELAASLAACSGQGHWTQQDAIRWWQEHQLDPHVDSSGSAHTELSNTEMLIDIDERIGKIRGQSV